MRRFFQLIGLAALLVGCAATNKEQAILPNEVIFTTGLTADIEPMDSVSRISIDAEQICIYIRWQLPNAEHMQITRIIDGEGKLVIQREDIFTPQPQKITSVCYGIDKSRDAAGTWRFEVYMDGQRMVEKTLSVL